VFYPRSFVLATTTGHLPAWRRGPSASRFFAWLIGWPFETLAINLCSQSLSTHPLRPWGSPLRSVNKMPAGWPAGYLRHDRLQDAPETSPVGPGAPKENRLPREVAGEVMFGYPHLQMCGNPIYALFSHGLGLYLVAKSIANEARPVTNGSDAVMLKLRTRRTGRGQVGRLSATILYRV
jgi:hypothetical protein